MGLPTYVILGNGYFASCFLYMSRAFISSGGKDRSEKRNRKKKEQVMDEKRQIKKDRETLIHTEHSEVNLL